jgi:hypothetical protein
LRVAHGGDHGGVVTHEVLLDETTANAWGKGVTG